VGKSGNKQNNRIHSKKSTAKDNLALLQMASVKEVVKLNGVAKK